MGNFQSKCPGLKTWMLYCPISSPFPLTSVFPEQQNVLNFAPFSPSRLLVPAATLSSGYDFQFRSRLSFPVAIFVSKLGHPDCRFMYLRKCLSSRLNKFHTLTEEIQQSGHLSPNAPPNCYSNQSSKCIMFALRCTDDCLADVVRLLAATHGCYPGDNNKI